MHGETQCKLLLWNACFWHNFLTGILQFTKQYGVMLTTSVFTNSLVSLYARQDFWFWQLFRCSSFLPSVFASITLYPISMDIILSQAEWASLRPCDLQEEIFLIQWIWCKIPTKCLASLHLIHQKKDFVLAMTGKQETWIMVLNDHFFNVRSWESFWKQLLHCF